MAHSIYLWIAFNIFILAMLAIDLGVFNRKAHKVSIREALISSVVWIVLALVFNVGIYYYMGARPALEFLTGYLIERALSMDNIFVFLLVFSYFGVPSKYQHKVLYWGIIGALVMRGLMIAVGAALIHNFEWVIYVFGAFLVFTGAKMAFHEETEIHPEKNPLVKICRKVFPVTKDYREGKFFLKEAGRLFATPLFIVLVVIETTDLVFAVDSIPAIFAVTTDTFIVYTSNIFAILGLRALYFALAGIMDLFHYLKYGLSVILVFVGIKMIIVKFYEIHIGVSLGIITLILVLSVLASIIWPKKEKLPTKPK